MTVIVTVKCGACPRLLAQLGALERRTGSTGRDVVDHAPGAHDDVANAAAGALVLAARSPSLRRLPSTFMHCAREAAGLRTECTLWGGSYFRSDPVCGRCPGWLHAKAAFARHVERGGEDLGLRAFVPQLRANEFTSRKREQVGIDALFL